ncbi:MAG: glycosyltransferase family 2 protein, partial [Chloroflexi bacterium]|nr:glycosyltransferase family 2 protein [Chloroflexota bacterium]
FGVPGLALLAVGVLQGWRVVDGYNHTNQFYVGPALLAVLFCCIGTLSLFTGIILNSIKSLLK